MLLCVRAILKTSSKLNDSILHFLRISKAHAQHIKQWYNSSSSGTTYSSNLTWPHVHGIACVPPLQLATPPGSQVYDIRKGNLALLCRNAFFLHIGLFFSSSRGSFLVLSAPGHAGSPPEVHGASLDPGRGLWHVLWGFKIAKIGK